MGFHLTCGKTWGVFTSSLEEGCKSPVELAEQLLYLSCISVVSKHIECPYLGSTEKCCDNSFDPFIFSAVPLGRARKLLSEKRIQYNRIFAIKNISKINQYQWKCIKMWLEKLVFSCSDREHILFHSLEMKCKPGTSNPVNMPMWVDAFSRSWQTQALVLWLSLEAVPSKSSMETRLPHRHRDRLLCLPQCVGNRLTSSHHSFVPIHPYSC